MASVLCRLSEVLRKTARRKPIRNDEATELRQCLSTLDLTLLGVGKIIATGLFVVTGEVARDIAGPAVILSFMIAGIAAILSALCFAEFGCRIRKAGSAYVYVYSSLGEIWGFMVGWILISEYMVSAAAHGRALPHYIDTLTNGSLTALMDYLPDFTIPGVTSSPNIPGLILVIAVMLLVASGVKHSSNLNIVVTVGKFVVVVLVVSIGFYFADLENWTDNFMPYGISGVLQGATSCFYGFIGFDALANASEESLNPQKSIPIAIMLALFIGLLAYFGVSSSLTLMIPYSDLASSAPLPNAFSSLGLPWMTYIVAIGGVLAITANLIITLIAMPRVLYAISCDGLQFECFSRVSPRTQVPVIATIVAGIVPAIATFILDLEALIEMVSLGSLIAYTFVALAVVFTRYQEDIQSLQVLDEEGKVMNYQTIQADEELKGQKLWPFKSVERNAAVAIVIFIVGCTGLFSVLLHSHEDLSDGKFASSVFLGVFSLTILFGGGLLSFQPKNGAQFPFTMPCVPVLPLLSVTANIFLLLQLKLWTWLRCLIWSVFGLILYFAYGIRYSKVESTVVDVEDTEQGVESSQGELETDTQEKADGNTEEQNTDTQDRV